MPFQSEKQRRYLHANHPEIAKRWERDYADGGITRIPFFKGAQADTAKGQAMSPGTSASGGTRHGGGGGGGGDGPPSVVHKPTGPTAEQIAAAKAKAEAEKRRLEAEARQKHLTDFKTTQKKKVKHKSNIRPFGFTEYEKLIKPGLYDHYKKSLPSYDSEGLDLQIDRVVDNLDILTKIKKGGIKTNEDFKSIDETLSPFGQTFQTFDYEYNPYKPTSENFWEGHNTLVTPVATFNTMKELKTLPGVTKEKMWSSDHKLTSEGKNLGKFIESSKKLQGSKNPTTGGGTIENIKSWMTDDKRQNIYKDYLNESGTDFNETIKDAIDKGLFEKKEDFTEQVNILEVKDGGPIRKKYSTGGVLDITGEEEITTEEGNDISLVDESETGVSTLFRAKNGGYAVQGGVKNYLGEQEMVSAPKYWQSAPDHPETELTYITKPEKNLLVKADLHGSLHGSINKGPQGLTSLNGWGDADDGFGEFGGTTSSGGGEGQEHANEFSGIDSGGWDPGVASDVGAVTSDAGWDNSVPDSIGPILHGGPEFRLTPTQKTNEINTIVKNKQQWDKDRWKRDTWTLINVPKTPWGIIPFMINQNKKKNERIAQIEEDLARLEKLGYESHPWEERGPGYGIKGDLEFEKFTLENPNWNKGPDDDKGDDGPTAPVVAPVTEEIEDSYAMVGDWLQSYRDLKAKQALSASLQEKWADEREWQQNTMFANSGGLANLFRVKNY